MTQFDIYIAREFSPELLQAVTSLLPQLTSSSRTITEHELKSMIASPTTTLLIASKDRKVIGMISLSVAQMPTGLRSYLEDLVVDASYRRYGVATALLQAALDVAKKSSAQTMDMTSRETRVDAIRLYDRLGFKRRDTNPFRFTF
jgi:ribosomal protein S18 acetylase RimI-like enzyme